MNADPEVMEFFVAPLTREESDAFVDRLRPPSRVGGIVDTGHVDERLNSNSAATPGMDPDEPIPDTPAELDEPELPAPPIEATPEDPGGDPGEEPAPV